MALICLTIFCCNSTTTLSRNTVFLPSPWTLLWIMSPRSWANALRPFFWCIWRRNCLRLAWIEGGERRVSIGLACASLQNTHAGLTSSWGIHLRVSRLEGVNRCFCGFWSKYIPCIPFAWGYTVLWRVVGICLLAYSCIRTYPLVHTGKNALCLGTYISHFLCSICCSINVLMLWCLLFLCT